MDRYMDAERLQQLLDEAEEKIFQQQEEEDAIEKKDIPGYEGRYAITRDGRVWSYRSGFFLSLSDNGKGYLYARLSDHSKTINKRVNRLVAEAFVEKPEGWEPNWDVAHEDDNRANNNWTNLKWKTRKENMDTDHFREHAKKRGKCPVLCVETDTVYPSQAAAARDLGVCQRSISSVINGDLLTTGGYHFKRVKEEAGQN